jgi:signal peptide peptidase SppA
MRETLLAIIEAEWARMADAVAHAGPGFSAPVRVAAGRKMQGDVAVIPLRGFLAKGEPSGIMGMLFGGTSADRFARDVVAALRDPSIGAVVMDVDSPGGEVAGTPEAAAMIRDARGGKPLISVANTIMGSAAYYIGAQADEVVVSPSGMVGSVGVFAAHVDESKALETEGRKVSLISYGRRKVEGNPYEPLTDEARASIQARVDYAGELFVADVAKGRTSSAMGRRVSADKVRAGYGEGAPLVAPEAVAAGVADRIATLDEVLSELVRGRSPRGGARAYDASELAARAALADFR